jgi:DnaK suppressor protein
MSDRTDIDTDRIAERLRTRRADLLATSAGASERRATVELDQQRVGRLSRMDALQDQAMAQETERRRLIELKRIDAALKRIDEDEYGYCSGCGDEIPKAGPHRT